MIVLSAGLTDRAESLSFRNKIEWEIGVAPALVTVLSSVSGFRMMEMFGLVEHLYSSVSGVSMEPGTFNSYSSFRLGSDALLTQPTR